MPVDLLVKIIEFTKNIFGFAEGAEISVEANPGTVTRKYLQELLKSGVNRISIGVQSFNGEELRNIGRKHTAEEAEKAILMAHQAGFTNINIDLMSGLPGQTAVSWKESLEKAVALGPQHLSLYELTFEPGTVMDRFRGEKAQFFPGDGQLEMIDRVTERICSDNQFCQYEISNYARPGYECLHNINYWLNGEYLAAGAGSVSYFMGCREKRINSPEKYISQLRSGHSVIGESEELTKEQSFRETVVMGLRMNRGISLNTLSKKFSIDVLSYYGDILKKLLDHSLLQLDGDYLYLTTRGRRLADSVMAELV